MPMRVRGRPGGGVHAFGSSFLSQWSLALLVLSLRARTGCMIVFAPCRRPGRTLDGRRGYRRAAPSSSRRYVSVHFPKLARMSLVPVVAHLSLLNDL